ncbi:hypothetical protein Psi01_17890 [Planobispora siamensis]|uniref:Uncharacterized protein n=1 Tax=Planobispora siamensis TaxID=936338 RepID=A0A8J3WHZ2_9ACTN|nr:hypothetical protein Psi01_17890 [Planobispora siamensis]
MRLFILMAQVAADLQKAVADETRLPVGASDLGRLLSYWGPHLTSTQSSCAYVDQRRQVGKGLLLWLSRSGMEPVVAMS